jgi:hypothetical protein
MLPTSAGSSSSATRATLVSKWWARLGEVERRIEMLLKLKAELKRMIVGCSRGRVAQCRIIEALATPTPVSIPADVDNRRLPP